MIDHILDVLAPHICTGCKSVGAVLCKSCMYDISEDILGVCAFCERPVLAINVCTACQTNVPGAQIYVVSWRNGAIKSLIDGYKFQRRQAAARILAELLDKRLPVVPPDTIITYIPTIPSHIRQRGYDHARLLAMHVAQRRGLQMVSLLNRHGQFVQRGANKATRVTQAEQSFSLANNRNYQHILLVDDIITTGSTLKVAMKLLQPIAPGSLTAGIIAKQPLDDLHDL